MPKPLAICAPHLGARSETFIRRHMQDLLPGGTVVVVNTAKKPYAGHWSVDCPVAIKNQIKIEGLELGIKDYVARQLGRRAPEQSAWLAIQRFLQQHQVRVILGEYLHCSFPFFRLAQQLGIPYYAHAHGIDVSVHIREPLWQKRYLYYREAAGIITVNQISRNRLIELGLEASKIHIIPCGIKAPDEPIKRTEGEIVRCIAVGRMVAKKAPIFLLEAFRQAVEKSPNLRLDYVGTGDLLPAAKQFVKAFALADKVTLHEGQPHEFVCQLMQEADIFLQHSITDSDSGDEEGLPVALLEAMGYALPVVTTRHAGIPDAVIDQETGFLVDEGDFKKMTQQLLLMAENFSLRVQMGLAGWQRVRELFTWEREKNSLLQLMDLSG